MLHNNKYIICYIFICQILILFVRFDRVKGVLTNVLPSSSIQCPSLRSLYVRILIRLDLGRFRNVCPKTVKIAVTCISYKRYYNVAHLCGHLQQSTSRPCALFVSCSFHPTYLSLDIHLRHQVCRCILSQLPGPITFS